MRRWLVFGSLRGFLLAGTVGCGKDSKPEGPSAPRTPRLPKSAGIDKKPDPGKKP